MIDGIPNRPLYFYQKDIIGCDFLFCDLLWLFVLWLSASPHIHLAYSQVSSGRGRKGGEVDADDVVNVWVD